MLRYRCMSIMELVWHYEFSSLQFVTSSAESYMPRMYEDL